MADTTPQDDPWDPDQYARFREERRRPFLDLLALLPPRPGARMLDLGCGTGELTRLAHERIGAAETLGIDRSHTMLARAAPLAGPGLSFARGDLLQATGRWDVVLSNAVLHWLPDHEQLLPRLCRLLAPGGRLAIHVPDNHDHSSHRVARETAEEEPFRSALGGFEKRRTVLPPERYAEILFGEGLVDIDVRLQIYGHALAGPEQVVEWVKGSLLNDWKERLPRELWEPFLARYRERLLAALPAVRPYYYTYRRLLLCASRRGGEGAPDPSGDNPAQRS